MACLGHMGILSLTVIGTARSVSKVGIPPAMYGVPVSPTTSPILAVGLLGSSHPDRCDVVSNCGFGSQLPGDE